jgi:hypothetical protein
VTGGSTLDASGNGSVSLTIDIASVALKTSAILGADTGQVVPDAPPVSVRFSATHLAGSATFSTRNDACPPEAGGCSCGGGYHGWLPGGG